ncbi:M23 family metallopeptidase [Marinifilum caeruleilacunae]|uniref:M23 family metallopeptidase n=1 Tax=Marinifilum caeruleilacunae TaxID=2499076 RepID=A0ABX1WZB2_9BACT|nr:M23 family metallopeptidase [Marinifilum caeruleilacunae]NOU61469.1 M23 family metallopeptidase [Marinifilum caeruleilacunae]
MSCKYFLLMFLMTLWGDLEYKLPVKAYDRKAIDQIELTNIGEFGLMRKERKSVPAHYHTGVDIKRPGSNYIDEPIYPICEGIVISKRQDGPYAQLIIEHDKGGKFWTVYEHVAGIKVGLFDEVSPERPIARFMNKEELDRYGWHFDHVHLEVLKIKPVRLERTESKPNRLFASYSLICYTREDLYKYFYDPIDFLNERLK